MSGVVLVSISTMAYDSSTDHVLWLMRENGFRVSVFHNPGSLYGAVLAFVEAHAVKGEQKYVVKVDVDQRADAEAACVCVLAELCGLELMD